MQDNQVSAPFKTQAGWHIVQREGTRQANLTDETRRASVRESIGQRKLEEEWNRYLREMRGEAYVDIRAGAGAAKPARARRGATGARQRRADMSRPRLALVPGEPAGVGPELCVRAAQTRVGRRPGRRSVMAAACNAPPPRSTCRSR